MVSDARKLSIQHYRQAKRDQLAVDVPKGKRELYKQAAANLGLSLSMLIQNSVENYAGINAGESLKPTQPQDTLTAADKKLIADFNRLPESTRKIISKLISDINQNNTPNKPD